MASPARLMLIGLVIACLIAGGAVVHMAMDHEPMEFYGEAGFDYPYAMFLFFGGMIWGPFVFLLGMLLYGFAYALVFAVQLLLRRR